MIDGGPCPVGVESTVLDLTGAVPLILRPGAITAEAIAKCLGREVEIAGKFSGKPPSPGMKYRHYAPRAPLLLITGPPARREKLIAALKRHYRRRNLKVGLLIPDQSVAPAVAARRLYRAMRAFDQQGVDLILAQEIPAEGLGAGHEPAGQSSHPDHQGLEGVPSRRRKWLSYGVILRVDPAGLQEGCDA